MKMIKTLKNWLQCPGWHSSVGWSRRPVTERLPVGFPVRAHSQVAGWIPGWGTCWRTPTRDCLSRGCFSLSLFLPLSNENKMNLFQKIHWSKQCKLKFIIHLSGWQKFTIQMFSPCRVCEVVVFWIARDSKTLKNPLEIFTKRKKQMLNNWKNS